MALAEAVSASPGACTPNPEFFGKRCETITVLALAGMSQSCD
jgi:hypothetical protein